MIVICYVLYLTLLHNNFVVSQMWFACSYLLHNNSRCAFVILLSCGTYLIQGICIVCCRIKQELQKMKVPALSVPYATIGAETVS